MDTAAQIVFNEEDKVNQNIEISLLLEAIRQKYGYDFRNYSHAHLKRRLVSRCNRSNLASMSEMTHKVLYDPEFFHTLLLDLSLNITEMFRDPEFYLAIREKIIPLLKTY